VNELAEMHHKKHLGSGCNVDSCIEPASTIAGQATRFVKKSLEAISKVQRQKFENSGEADHAPSRMFQEQQTLAHKETCLSGFGAKRQE
jgi:hypothetical protein